MYMHMIHGEIGKEIEKLEKQAKLVDKVQVDQA